MPAIALAFVAAKATCFVLGSLIHEGKELMKHCGVDRDDISKASCLLIKDEQLGLQETSNESPSNALVLYASQEIVLSSRSRALAILTNDDVALETSFNAIESLSLSIMKSFNFSAAWAWFRTRFIDLMQSALSSVMTDMKMATSLFIGGSVSENMVEKKAVASFAFFIQANFCRIMARVLVILKEAINQLKSRSERNVSTLLGHVFPAEFRGKEVCFDLLPDINSVGDSIAVDVGTCTQMYLAMVTTCLKRALEILSDYSTSLLRPLRLHGLNVMAMVLLLFVSISLIGRSTPLIFKCCKPEEGILQEPCIPEAASGAGVEAGAFSSIMPLFAYRSDGTSNADLMESMDIGNFDDLNSSLVATGKNGGQVDLDHLRLADFTSSLHLWPARDFSITSMPDLQIDVLWDDKVIAGSLDDWNIDAHHSIQSKSGYADEFGSALGSSLLMQELVPGEVHASYGRATEYFDCYSLTATVADEAFVLRFISQSLQNQSSVALELEQGSPPSSTSTFDGDTPTTPMLIIIAAGSPQELCSPQELSVVNYVPGGFDRYTDTMKVDDRCFDSMVAKVHETHRGLDHPGSVMLLWSSNNLIAADLSLRQSKYGYYFWNHMTAFALPLVWNIEVSHCIQSQSTPFICMLGGLWSDRFVVLVVAIAFDGYTVFADDTSTFISSLVAQASQNQSSVESLGHSILTRSVSDENSLSMQSFVAELGASNEICPIQCRDVDRTTASEAMTLPAPSDRHRALPIRSRRMLSSAAAQPSLKFGALKESSYLDVFSELRQLVWILLMLAYRNSDDATKEDCVLLSSESEMSTGMKLDLEEACDDEMIFVGEENEADEALLWNTNSKPSRYELTALHSELGRHWKSPSKRRMRRSSRFRSRPKYFEPTLA